MDVSFDTSALSILEQAWRQVPEIAREEMLKSITEADLLIEREVKEHTPTGIGGGGGLRGSIASAEEVSADNVIGLVGTALNYAVPVELGTKPHYPPVQAIEQWVKAKLDVPASEVRSVAHAIVQKIGRVGTDGAFMFEKAFDSTAGQVDRILAAGVERIQARLATP